jgi:phosphatidylinositol alpha-mannosyltransferase
MRIGLVSPYPWDVPGGVVAHVRELAEALIELGHEVSVMTPVDDDEAPLPPYAVRAGRTVGVPYNGSVARLVFGPVSYARIRKWLAEGRFDVLHVHEPTTLSLSLLALTVARGPIVATFHSANPRSRILSLLQSPLQTQLEKVTGRIAVSLAARKTIVEHLGGDAVLIPNGVRVDRYAGSGSLPSWDAEAGGHGAAGAAPSGHGAAGAAAPRGHGTQRPGGTIGFLGRMDEPRKGLAVLLAAFGRLARRRAGLRLLVAGPGETDDVAELIPHRLRDRVEILGVIDEADKPAFFRSVDVYAAPNVGGESFGIILLEAMAAGAPIVASDLAAFRLVLQDGRAGRLAAVGDAEDLAAGLAALLDDAGERDRLAAAGKEIVRGYDWPVIATEVLRVYETVAESGRAVEEEPERVEESR